MGIRQIINSVFVENMADIPVELGEESSSPITVSVDGIDRISFRLYGVGGQVNIHTSDIARSFMQAQDPCIDTNDPIEIPLPKLQISCKNETATEELSIWTTPMIFGGYDDDSVPSETAFLRHSFLTVRPQQCRVVPGVKEQLTFVIIEEDGEAGVAHSPNVRSIKATIYFRAAMPLVLELFEADGNDAMYRIDCSLNTIEQLVRNQGIDDIIVAYDIWGDGDVQIYPQRFVVAHISANQTHFFFQNSLGGFDTVTASGTAVAMSEGENIIASYRQEESELGNNYRDIWEVNTGYIQTLEEERLWRDFLRSSNRWLLTPNGKSHRIIVDEYKAERPNLQLGAFTIKFHLAKQAKTKITRKTSLDNYTHKI